MAIYLPILPCIFVALRDVLNQSSNQHSRPHVAIDMQNMRCFLPTRMIEISFLFISNWVFHSHRKCKIRCRRRRSGAEGGTPRASSSIENSGIAITIVPKIMFSLVSRDRESQMLDESIIFFLVVSTIYHHRIYHT